MYEASRSTSATSEKRAEIRFAVVRQAHALLDERRHAALLHVEQLLVANDLGHQREEVRDLPLPVGHLAVEVGEHLEDLAEVLVSIVEHVVEPPVADHHDLHVEVHRLRLDRLPGQGEQNLARPDDHAPVA